MTNRYFLTGVSFLMALAIILGGCGCSADYQNPSNMTKQNEEAFTKARQSALLRAGLSEERRQELRNIAARLKKTDMRDWQGKYSFPIEDMVRSIEDEQIQLIADVYHARDEYEASVAHDADDCFWFYFRSPKETWERLCGQAGWMVLSKKDLRQIAFFLVVMN